MTISTPTNLAAKADQIVVELGVNFRSNADCAKQLQQGIEICDQVMRQNNVDEPSQPKEKGNRNKTLKSANDNQTTIELDIEAASTLKTTLEKIVDGDSILNNELLASIQDQLMRITLSTWRSTTNELKERREKRGLRWRRS